MRNLRLLTAIIMLLLSACGGGSSANKSPGLTSVAYGRGIYLAVGADSTGGLIAETSTDGVAWQRHSVGDQTLKNYLSEQVAAGPAGFLIADSYSNLYFSSTGTIWNKVLASAIHTGDTVHMSWDGAEFVVAASGTLYTSADGNSWTSVAAGTVCGGPSEFFTKFAGKWFAVADSVVYSSDFVKWSGCEPNDGLLNVGIMGLFVINSQLIQMTIYGAVGSSSDGINWTTLSPGHSSLFGYSAVATNGLSYLLAPGRVFPSKALSFSPDGVSWQDVDLTDIVGSSSATIQINSIAAAPNGAYVAVGADSFGPIEITSADGTHWVQGTP